MVSVSDADSVVTAFYEAAALPQLWRGALQSFADLTGSRGAVLSRANREHDALICSAHLDDTGVQFFEQGWNTRDFRTSAFLDRPGLLDARETMIDFVADQDIISPDDMKASDYYRDFARSAGVPWFCATGMRLVNGVIVGLTLQRSDAQGAFGAIELDKLNALLPRLRNPLSLASRIAGQRNDGLTEGLGSIDEAAILLDENGNVTGINGAAEAMIGTVLRRRGHSIATVDPTGRARFAAFIEAGCGRRDGSSVMPSPMRLTRAHDTPVLAQLIPIAGQARDLFGTNRTLLLLSPLGRVRPRETALLRAAFDLTPGEARVARLLATGMAARPIAAALAISENAVRFHIKAILSKNGFRRQAQFVAAAAAISVPVKTDSSPETTG